MFPALIGAGLSQLTDLLQSATGAQGSGASFSVPTGASATASGAQTTDATGAIATDLNRLLIDLQAAQSNSTGSGDPAKAAAGHHHHHAAAYGKGQALGTPATTTALVA